MSKLPIDPRNRRPTVWGVTMIVLTVLVGCGEPSPADTDPMRRLTAEIETQNEQIAKDALTLRRVEHCLLQLKASPPKSRAGVAGRLEQFVVAYDIQRAETNFEIADLRDRIKALEKEIRELKR